MLQWTLFNSNIQDEKKKCSSYKSIRVIESPLYQSFTFFKFSNDESRESIGTPVFASTTTQFHWNQMCVDETLGPVFTN